MQQRKALREAIAAVERGDKVVARRLLGEILQSDPGYTEAWLWMSRVAKDERQRRECLRRALSPVRADAAGHSPTVEPARPAEGSPPSYVTFPDPAFPDMWDPDQVSILPDLATRNNLVAEQPPLSASQRQAGQRRIMLMSAMTLSLLCGASMLLFLVATAVPRAHERIRQHYQSTPYAAILWCPSCEESGELLTLWDRPGAAFRARAGMLAHGTPVSVATEQWVTIEGRMYVEVEANGQSGWVRATYVRH
jgi:hypothetical protein